MQSRARQLAGAAALVLAATAAYALVVEPPGSSDSPASLGSPASRGSSGVGASEGSLDPSPEPGSIEDGTDPSEPEPPTPEDLGQRPEVTDISAWLNTNGDTFDEVRSEVTVVQFWTFGCQNCKATLPYLQDLYARHGDRVEIIGIHSHEFERERDPENVAEAVEELGVTWPVALDTNKTNFREWQGARRFWPRTYVIDSQDRIRFDHIGEGSYDELNRTVDALLEKDS